MSNGKCRISGQELVEVLDLGDQYISDFVKKGYENKVDKSPLKLGICKESKLLQLFDTYSQKKIYEKYWYKSGVNEKMIEELNSIVNSTERYLRLKKGDIAVDIASNDGTLLNFYSKDIDCLGFDPSDVAKNSKNYNQNKILINDFFSAKLYENIFKKKKQKLLPLFLCFMI